MSVTDISFPTEIQSVHMTDTAAGGSWSELKSGCTATTSLKKKGGGVGGGGGGSERKITVPGSRLQCGSVCSRTVNAGKPAIKSIGTANTD